MIIGSGSNRNKNNSLKANFNVKQFTTFIHEFELYYVNTYNQEVPYDFTDSYLQFNIKSKYGTVIKQAGTINVIDNIVRLYIGADDLDFYGKYKYELVVTSSTNETSTLVEGEINIERSVVTTLQEITNEFSLSILSLFTMIINRLLKNDIGLFIKSSYSFLFNIIYEKKEQIKSNYIVTLITTFLKTYNLSISSSYIINQMSQIKYLFSISILSSYVINQIIKINHALTLLISSSYVIRNITTIKNIYFNIITSYSIMTSQTRGATININSSYTIEIGA